jgi:hypothetical protein
MIKGIVSNGKYTVVSSGTTNVPYISYNSNNPIQGMIRISGNDMQVFDGASWVVMGTSYASVGLSPDAEKLLDWARQKRDEEAAILKLAETNLTIKKLLAEMNKYKDQIDMISVLIKEEVKV